MKKCRVGKTHHSFKIWIYCPICDTTSEKRITIRCLLNRPQGGKIRNVGCLKRKNERYVGPVYFECESGAEDTWRILSKTDDTVKVRVTNVDEED